MEGVCGCTGGGGGGWREGWYPRIFFYFFTKNIQMHVVGTHYKSLAEALLMSTTIYFHQEKRKISIFFH